ncbi:MAG: DoxX family protein [Pseudomonadota bacterium]
MSYESTATAPAPSRARKFFGLIFGRGPFDGLADMPAWILGLVLLAPRIWLAIPFWDAGQIRLASFSRQPMFFQAIHPVPFLDPSTAAYLTTGAEIILPVLLVFGFFGRWAALGLAVMAATIFFIVGQTPQGMQNGIAIASEQFPWMFVGLALFVIGPGRVSIDYGIRRLILKDR